MGRLKDDDQVTMMRVELVPNETHLACTKLWEFDKMPQADKRTVEERSAVKQLQQHLSRKQDSRYFVRLPRVEDPPELGDSRRMAVSRLRRSSIGTISSSRSWTRWTPISSGTMLRSCLRKTCSSHTITCQFMALSRTAQPRQG